MRIANNLMHIFVMGITRAERIIVLFHIIIFLLYSIPFLDAFLLILSARHARNIQSKGASFGSLCQEFRVADSAAKNRRSRQEAARERKLQA